MQASSFGISIMAACFAACSNKPAQPPVQVGGSQVAVPTSGSPATIVTAPDPKAAPKADAPAAPAPKAEAPVVPPAPAEVVPLDAAEFEKLVRALATCKLEGPFVARSCPEYLAYQRATTVKGASVRMSHEARVALAKSLLSHESPALRVTAAELLVVGKDVPVEQQAVILEAYEKEKEPAVQAALLRTVADEGVKNPKVGPLLLAAMDNPGFEVRGQAIHALGAPANRGLAGAAERLAMAAAKDEDMTIRRAACNYAGRLGSEAMMPVYKKLTAADVDPELQASCMKGVVAMWVDFPAFENASEAAYRLTLKLLERDKRNKEMPSWVAIRQMEKLASDSERSKAWRAKATWYDAAAVRAALAEVVADPEAAEPARAAAIEVMALLGATKADVEALKKPIEDGGRLRPKSLLAKAFEKALAAPELTSKP